jgi:tetratricopeptide (TPR) repeat protein
MSRLTRREMKRDEVAEAFGRTVEYSRSHGRTVLLAVVAVVAVAVAVAVVYTWRQRALAETNEKLAAAMRVYAAPIDADAPKPDDPEEPSFASEEARRERARALFEEAEKGSGGAADVPLVYLGQLAADGGDTAAARELWRRFLDRHPDHMLAGSVRVSLIGLDRAEGEGEKVAADLETMLELSPEERPLPGDVVLYELGQTYEALGRDADARSIYQRLVEEYPRSAFAGPARSKAAPAAGAGALPTGLGAGG